MSEVKSKKRGWTEYAFFQYSAHILPKITLIGQDLSTSPHRNMRRVSNDCVYYLITDGEIRFEEDGIPYRLTQGDCFLFEPGKLHFGTENTRYQLRYIHFWHPDLAQSELTEKEWLNKADRDNKQWLTGATIEKDLSYNFDYLNQLFRRHLDTSIFQMLETIRMEVAKNLIQTGGFSMQYIANEVGFKDEPYFSKVFKKHNDLSPIQYRKSIKNTRL